MLRSSPTLATLVLAGLLPACHDAATLPPGPETTHGSSVAEGPAEPSARPTAGIVVRVLGDDIRVGDAVVARARPATAPGALDEDLRASYVLPPLREALRETKTEPPSLIVVLAPSAPLSHLRAVLASAGAPVRVILDPNPAAAKITDARVGFVLHAASPAGDDPERPAPVAIELPDDRPVSTLEPLAAASPASPTLVLAIDAPPCVEPPNGMRCLAGGHADQPTTFYVDQRAVTVAEYDACHEASGCRARRRASQGETEPSAQARLDEARAQAYCAWAGKRVLTDAEQATLAPNPAKLGLRCATSQPFLTRFPPRILDTPRASLDLPEPPTPEELAIFTRVVDDPVEDKKICGAKVRAGWHASQLDGGRSEPTCRDPFSYLTTNEPRGFVWRAYIRNIGGAYVGIGSDQSYSYIATARSRWAWVVDYDPRVVQNHLRLRAFVLAAPTPEEFVALFAPKNKHRALAILDEAYPEDPRLATLRWGYLATRDELLPYFSAQQKRSRYQHGFGWLREPESYQYIRTMFEQGRISIKAGDLLVDGAMQQMGAAARELGVPVRVYYTSNAPTAWGGQVTPAYRRNVLSLPFDAESLVLQTTDGGGSLRQKTKWHHNVQWGRLLHERLEDPSYDNVWKLLEGRIPGDDQALTVLGLPSR